MAKDKAKKGGTAVAKAKPEKKPQSAKKEKLPKKHLVSKEVSDAADPASGTADGAGEAAAKPIKYIRPSGYEDNSVSESEASSEGAFKPDWRTKYKLSPAKIKEYEDWASKWAAKFVKDGRAHASMCVSTLSEAACNWWCVQVDKGFRASEKAMDPVAATWSMDA